MENIYLLLSDTTGYSKQRMKKTHHHVPGGTLLSQKTLTTKNPLKFSIICLINTETQNGFRKKRSPAVYLTERTLTESEVICLPPPTKAPLFFSLLSQLEPKSRLNLFSDCSWLNELLTLRQDEPVLVYLRDWSIAHFRSFTLDKTDPAHPIRLQATVWRKRNSFDSNAESLTVPIEAIRKVWPFANQPDTEPTTTTSLSVGCRVRLNPKSIRPFHLRIKQFEQLNGDVSADALDLVKTILAKSDKPATYEDYMHQRTNFGSTLKRHFSLQRNQPTPPTTCRLNGTPTTSDGPRCRPAAGTIRFAGRVKNYIPRQAHEFLSRQDVLDTVVFGVELDAQPPANQHVFGLGCGRFWNVQLFPSVVGRAGLFLATDFLDDTTSCQSDDNVSRTEVDKTDVDSTRFDQANSDHTNSHHTNSHHTNSDYTKSDHNSSEQPSSIDGKTNVDNGDDDDDRQDNDNTHQTTVVPLATSDEDAAVSEIRADVDRLSLGLESMVEIPVEKLVRSAALAETASPGRTLHGVIKWIGWLDVFSGSSETGGQLPAYLVDCCRNLMGLPNGNGHQESEDDKPTSSVTVAGVELETSHQLAGDGRVVRGGPQLFKCAAGHGLFVPLELCTSDTRFIDRIPRRHDRTFSEALGGKECQPIDGLIASPEVLTLNHWGRNRGIQGHQNSCYIDATLYAMFAWNNDLNHLLLDPGQARHSAISAAHSARLSAYLPSQVRQTLRESIVNPLRQRAYVRADRVFDLRCLLDQLSSVEGLKSEEKDPEEFLTSLLEHSLAAGYLLQTGAFFRMANSDSSSKDDLPAKPNATTTDNLVTQGSHIFQLVPERHRCLSKHIPNVQQLLQLSCISYGLRFSERPECLMLQLPRFGKDFRLHEQVFPSFYLSLDGLLAGKPLLCSVCHSRVAQFFCRDCFENDLTADSPSPPTAKAHCNGNGNGNVQQNSSDGHSETSGLSRATNGLLCNAMRRTHLCSLCNAQKHSSLLQRRHSVSQLQTTAGREETSDHGTDHGTDHRTDHRTDHGTEMELFGVVCITTSHYVALAKCGRGVGHSWVFFDSMADRVGAENGYNIPQVLKLDDWERTVDGAAVVLGHGRPGSGQVVKVDPLVRRICSDPYVYLYRPLVA